jgi:hypothetical protein
VAGKYYKTPFAGLAYLGLHIKFGGLSVTEKKVMSHCALLHHNTPSKQSVTTFLFVTESLYLHALQMLFYKIFQPRGR